MVRSKFCTDTLPISVRGGLVEPLSVHPHLGFNGPAIIRTTRANAAREIARIVNRSVYSAVLLIGVSPFLGTESAEEVDDPLLERSDSVVCFERRGRVGEGRISS